jgi:ABC-type transport system involved in cytochrome bd biosynthesis fused ATPase/permease subunit
MDSGLGIYFLIGIVLGFTVRAFLKVLEANALEQKAREQEAIRRRKVAELYGKPYDEK